MEKEIWKEIKNYEGLYEVSNYGNVRSLKRFTTNGKILKLRTDKDGYLNVCLSKNNKCSNFRVHRLVADAFVCGRTKEKNIVNHKDEDVRNNRADNLEWCDVKYNTNYNGASFRRCRNRRKPIVAYNKNEALIFESIIGAAKALNSTHGNISGCLHHRRGRKSVKGYSFCFLEEYEHEIKKNKGM